MFSDQVKIKMDDMVVQYNLNSQLVSSTGRKVVELKTTSHKVHKSSVCAMTTSFRCDKLIMATFILLIFSLIMKANSFRCARSYFKYERRDAHSLTAVRRDDLVRFNFALQLSGESDGGENSRQKPNNIKNQNTEEEDEDQQQGGDARFLIKEIEGENNTKTGQFIFSKKNGKDSTPIFAFSTPPAPLSDSLIVVGATVGGLFGLVVAFLLSNKDIVPFPSH